VVILRSDLAVQQTHLINHRFLCRRLWRSNPNCWCTAKKAKANDNWCHWQFEEWHFSNV